MGLSLLAFGGATLLSPSAVHRFSLWFRSSKAMAAVLTAGAWAWTAVACDAIGIEAIDRFTKAFPGELWLLAAVLTVLTVAWMPRNLPVRALTGLLMLLPAELFKTTHLYRPPVGTGPAPIDLFVLVAYAGTILGMYGMFYPWRLEKGLDLALARPRAARLLGGVCAAVGLALVLIGFRVS